MPSLLIPHCKQLESIHLTWYYSHLLKCPKTIHSKNNKEEKSKQALNDSIFTLYDFLMIILVIYLKIYFES